MWSLSKNWIIEGLVESTGFDFHWFELSLIAAVMLWATHLCHVYSSCVSFFGAGRIGDTGDLRGFRRLLFACTSAASHEMTGSALCTSHVSG